MRKILLLSFLFLTYNTSFSQTWQLVWSDEFTTQISSDWVMETGGGNQLWGNNELENYRTDNASIESGNLVITGKKETIGGFNYTSARLKTQGKQSWQYGKMEAYVRVPFVTGTWPAFWMMGNAGEWPACGEIDIMEQVNLSKVIEGTAHWYDANEAANDPANYQETSSGGIKTVSSLNGTDYHLYSVEWDTDSVRWFIDNVRYFKTSIKGSEQTEMHQPFYLILNLSIGGEMTGNVQPDDSKFPVKMYVDYVKVYQKSTVTEVEEPNVFNTDEVILYPNPSSSVLYIKGAPENSIIKCYNSLGTKVLETSDNKINMYEWPNGSYNLTVETTTGLITKKFFKQ